MIVQLPTQPENGFSHYTLLILGWVFSNVITLGGGYWLGLRSQVHAEKLKARNAAFAIIDKILADIPKKVTLLHLFSSTRDNLRDAVFGFSCQLSVEKRLRIKEALNNYQALKMTGSPIFPTVGMKLNVEEIEKERKAMFESLKNLRDVIANV